MVYAHSQSRIQCLTLSGHTKEYGIFDALEKRYLRSFIFGIYLVGPGNASSDFVRINLLFIPGYQGPYQVNLSCNLCTFPISYFLSFFSIVEAYTFNFKVRKQLNLRC